MNRAEFTARVQAMTDRLYRISYGQLREEQDRRDAVQETLMKAWAGLPRLRREEYFETWVIRILLNECHDRQRRARRELPLDSAPEPVAPDFDGDVEVRDAVRALPEKLRTVVLLHYMEGYQVGEVARILRLPLETVRSRLRRARAELRMELEESPRKGS